jgi:DNA-binding CsgD family transcriptional regulator
MTRASNRNRRTLFDRDERGSVANLDSSGSIENGRHSSEVATPKRSRAELQKAPQDARASDRTGLVTESSRLAKAKASCDPKEQRGCSHDLMLAGLNALDVVDVGVVVADGLGRLLLVNQVARQILDARDGIALSSSGMLEVVSGCGRRPLRLPKERATTGAGDAWKNDTMEAVQRRSGRRPLTILVRSLDANRTNYEPVGPAFLIFMLDPERPVEATEAALRELYKFTATEARLAKLLMSGRTFEQCCEQLGVRPSTIRMHLGNLFAKTGVQRQGQLVSLLLKSVGMVRTGGEPGGFPQTAIDSRVGVQSENQVKTGEMFSASVEALHWLDMGIVVINGTGQVLFVNEQATRILAARDGLEVTTRGALSAGKNGSSLAVKWSSGDPSEDVVMAIQRPSGKRALTLIIRSLGSSEHPCDVDKPRALVFLLDPETSAATESRLLRLYGLTASEARLARLLMDGRTIDDCCEPLDICPSTARRHLANIFAKTNVRHQGQLISLLLKSTGPVRARNDSVTVASPARCVSMPGPWAVTNALRSVRP